ncbi:MAG: hypothetical protein IID03_12380 [Candidatus Dadabacteria bacterium]|nr:hypothetical protein [Candidatus Dadabacteria bacterium]
MKIKEKLDTWGYRTDPEGLTNYDGVQMGITALAIVIINVFVLLQAFEN